MVNVSHGLDDFIRLNFVVNIPNQIVGLSVFHLISLQGKVIKRVLFRGDNTLGGGGGGGVALGNQRYWTRQ